MRDIHQAAYDACFQESAAAAQAEAAEDIIPASIYDKFLKEPARATTVGKRGRSIAELKRMYVQIYHRDRVHVSL
jgi:Na+-translocating ferredoxin:NAD+ oxidoreductase RnfG subunit